MNLTGRKLFLVMALITFASCFAHRADAVGVQTLSLNGLWQVAPTGGNE